MGKAQSSRASASGGSSQGAPPGEDRRRRQWCPASRRNRGAPGGHLEAALDREHGVGPHARREVRPRREEVRGQRRRGGPERVQPGHDVVFVGLGVHAGAQERVARQAVGRSRCARREAIANGPTVAGVGEVFAEGDRGAQRPVVGEPMFVAKVGAMELGREERLGAARRLLTKVVVRAEREDADPVARRRMRRLRAPGSPSTRASCSGR